MPRTKPCEVESKEFQRILSCEVRLSDCMPRELFHFDKRNRWTAIKKYYSLIGAVLECTDGRIPTQSSMLGALRCWLSEQGKEWCITDAERACFGLKHMMSALLARKRDHNRAPQRYQCLQPLIDRLAQDVDSAPDTTDLPETPPRSKRARRSNTIDSPGIVSLSSTSPQRDAGCCSPSTLTIDDIDALEAELYPEMIVTPAPKYPLCAKDYEITPPMDRIDDEPDLIGHDAKPPLMQDLIGQDEMTELVASCESMKPPLPADYTAAFPKKKAMVVKKPAAKTKIIKKPAAPPPPPPQLPLPPPPTETICAEPKEEPRFVIPPMEMDRLLHPYLCSEDDKQTVMKRVHWKCWQAWCDRGRNPSEKAMIKQGQQRFEQMVAENR